MKNYPTNIEQKIGFDTIRSIIANYCTSELGSTECDKIAFSNNFLTIQTALAQIQEMKQILEFEQDFPHPSFVHIHKAIHKIKPFETFLQTQELFDLRKSLLEIHHIYSFFDKHQDLYPNIHTLALEIFIPLEVCTAIDKIIDSNAQLKDNASKKLIEIRSDIASKKSSVAKIMNQKIAIARKEGWLESDSELTVRNERLVLPLFTAFKRKFQGFVHDESISGKTSFVEPIEAFEINNSIQSLHFEEQKEIIRILKDITATIRPFIPNIEQAYWFLGCIDALYAKSKLAILLNAQKPCMVEHPEISLIGAKHPLLIVSFKKSGKEVIPLRVVLDTSQRLLIISGPNAGGKSVCLKTIALLQYMFQCGLLIPADQHSCLGIFDSLYIDIGDEQSLENDLSTYSSHLHNMKYFLTHAHSKTLVCIDEFGTGTEPMLGGAIAESILEALHNQGVFGVITTHYTNLKHAASALPHAINGAMLFDLQIMKPLFKLRMGSAGSSFAFEIATEIGLPESVIQHAKNKLGKEHVDFDKNLKKLEEEKQYIFKKREELHQRELSLQKIQEEYSQKIATITSKRAEIIDQTKKEMQQLLHETNKNIEQAIRTIKESQAEKKATIEARKILEQQHEKTRSAIESQAKTINKLDKQHTQKHHNKAAKINEELRLGDYVHIQNQTAIGEIVEIKNKKAVVAFSHARMNVPIETLVRTKKPKSNTHTQIIQSSTKAISEKRSVFSTKLDVRGKRADEAMYEVKDFIESAYMLQISHVDILHGKGWGILRKLIREYLDTLSFVSSCTDAPIEMGGDGITVVTLKL